VAVIGMAGRFPGARNVEEFWRNLCAGTESICRFDTGELRAAGVAPALAAHPQFVPAGGVLEDADLCDAALFQLTPREASLLDPQHRQLLECAWEALEDAGCDPARFSGPIGVFAGAGLNGYLLHNLMPGGELAAVGGDAQVAIANEKDFLATRISYKLHLTGPSLDVQTACSTSLVAVVLACQSLLNYQCDLALAGGVAVREPQRGGYLYQEHGILSPDGHCRPFDAAARGTVPGSGAGLVVLRRLEDALADRDTVRAVIRGAAVNNDGAAKVGYTAPSVRGQAEVIGLALAVAGVKPRDISFIETHGTATPLGDPIELRALDRVFRADTAERGFCTLGAVKSNVGHLDAAAGVAGLIKAVLALERRQIPPTLHFIAPNPEIDLAATAFRVNGALLAWDTDRLPRRAGVSSFGIGGTNAHLVLEEAPAPTPAAAGRPLQLLVLSARTGSALSRATAEMAEHLLRHPEGSLADVAFTLQVGRAEMAHRRALVCREAGEAAAALAAEDPERLLSHVAEEGDRPVIFLFPGLGDHHEGMGRELYAGEPVFRAEVDRCAEVLRPELGLDLRHVLYPETAASLREPAASLQRATATAGRQVAATARSRPQDGSAGDVGNAGNAGSRGPAAAGAEGEPAVGELRRLLRGPAGFLAGPEVPEGEGGLARTRLAQPAIFVVALALARLWMSWGIRPRALLGYSVGEYVAACLSGVL
jgi:acyl transferase domain-containing protein